MTSYRPGDVVLVSFPFTNAAGVKRRPALMLVDNGDQDVLVARVTSQAPRSSYDVQLSDWQQGGLLLPSVVRVDKLATIDRRLITRTLGALTQADWALVRARIQSLWNSI